MPPEIVALIGKPWLLAALIAVGAFFGMAVQRFFDVQDRAKRRAYWQGRKSQGKTTSSSVRKMKAVTPHEEPERAKIVATD